MNFKPNVLKVVLSLVVPLFIFYYFGDFFNVSYLVIFNLIASILLAYIVWSMLQRDGLYVKDDTPWLKHGKVGAKVGLWISLTLLAMYILRSFILGENQGDFGFSLGIIIFPFFGAIFTGLTFLMGALIGWIFGKRK
jgi:hypothetical protein